MPKVARNAFNIGNVWNLVCCNGNETVKFLLWSIFSRVLLQSNLRSLAVFKHFDLEDAKKEPGKAKAARSLGEKQLIRLFALELAG